MPCHSLSHVITPYPLDWTQNQVDLPTLKLVPTPLIFVTSFHTLLLLITPYQILSPNLETKLFSFGNFKIVPTPHHN